MKTIELSRGYFATVDDRDYATLSKLSWHAVPVHNSVYARISDGTYMHQMLLSSLPGFDIDHIDGDGLNNRRKNLRVVTHRENLANTGMYANNTSGYRGVVKHGPGFRATTKQYGTPTAALTVSTAEEAAMIYDEMARRLLPEGTYLNFPTRQATPEVARLAEIAIQKLRKKQESKQGE